MAFYKKNELSVHATILSFIISLLLYAVAFVVLVTTKEGVNVATDDLILLQKSEPLMWVFAVLVFIIPLATFSIFIFFNYHLNKKNIQLTQDNENNKIINNYINDLIKEKYDSEIELEGQKQLEESLIALNESLKDKRDQALKRSKEDKIRNWSTEGVTKFGEILRRDNHDLDKLAYNVIKNLTNYIDAVQGGFYLLQDNEEEDPYFELITFYAYGRKKYADQKLPINKGIIGTSSLEKKTIYMTDLPDSYVNVTSGLGKSNPRSILVSPLRSNGQVYGVFEIASLHQMAPEVISFVEEIAENTAATLATVKMNMKTAQLLEESKEQALALSSQEEEMRQNMEELQATQEEAGRQAKQFVMLENTVNHTMIRAEYATDGTLKYANTKFLNKLEYNKTSDVEGKHITMFISDKDKEWFTRIWNNLESGGRHFEGYMKHITQNGKDLWTMATYTCIRDDEGEVEKILFLALDTTEQKILSLKMEGIIDAVNRSSIKLEFDINGNLKDFNETFTYLFKYSEKEALSLSIFDLVAPMELELFNKKWDNIIRGMNFQGHFKAITKHEEEKWIRGAFSAVFDMYGEIDKIIYIGNDITNEKLMEIESKKQNDILKVQEKQLRENEKVLNQKLKQAKEEMIEQFKETEKIKIRNERTLEGALDAIITTSQSNKVLFFNEAAVNLTGYGKEEVLNNKVNMLFSEETISSDEFVKKYISLSNDKIIGSRKEIKINKKNGEEINVLMLLSKAKVGDETTYTAFIQTIEVELF